MGKFWELRKMNFFWKLLGILVMFCFNWLYLKGVCYLKCIFLDLNGINVMYVFVEAIFLKNEYIKYLLFSFIFLGVNYIVFYFR